MNAQENRIKKNDYIKRDIGILLIKVLLFIPLTYTLIEYESYYEQSEILRRIAYALNVFLSANILISACRIILIFWFKRRSLYSQTSTRGSFLLGVNRITSVLNAAIIIFSIMLAFNINPIEFLTSITIVAAAIALIFREYITNMISGLIIMFSDQLTLGDYIKIGEYQGQIIDITLANIVINNDDDDTVLIPNNYAFTTSIVNQSFQNSRKVSVEFELPLNHAIDREALKTRLVTVLNPYRNELQEDSLKLKVLAVQKDFVKYKVQFILSNKGKAQSQFIKNVILNEVLKIG